MNTCIYSAAYPRVFLNFEKISFHDNAEHEFIKYQYLHCKFGTNVWVGQIIKFEFMHKCNPKCDSWRRSEVYRRRNYGVIIMFTLIGNCWFLKNISKYGMWWAYNGGQSYRFYCMTVTPLYLSFCFKPLHFLSTSVKSLRFFRVITGKQHQNEHSLQ
jgi:hypothetical protein